MKEKLLVGISIGDPNGIGPEVIIKALSESSILETITPIVYCPKSVLLFYEKNLNIKLNYVVVDSPVSAVNSKINIISYDIKKFSVIPGHVSKEAGEIAFKSLRLATDDLFNSETDVIVTAPINKDNIQNKEFNFMGHTEYFTSKCKKSNSLMLMTHHSLRVGLVTNHLPVSLISENILEKNILEKLNLFNNTLKKDFNLSAPKIALLGLNPHAGDNGLIGNQENKVIIPSIKKANLNGILASGPFPADGFFCK
jgi:4-hydroxythreonine-4-phosphate dehydrogenase